MYDNSAIEPYRNRGLGKELCIVPLICPDFLTCVLSGTVSKK